MGPELSAKESRGNLFQPFVVRYIVKSYNIFFTSHVFTVCPVRVKNDPKLEAMGVFLAPLLDGR